MADVPLWATILSASVAFFLGLKKHKLDEREDKRKQEKHEREIMKMDLELGIMTPAEREQYEREKKELKAKVEQAKIDVNIKEAEKEAAVKITREEMSQGAQAMLRRELEVISSQMSNFASILMRRSDFGIQKFYRWAEGLTAAVSNATAEELREWLKRDVAEFNVAAYKSKFGLLGMVMRVLDQVMQMREREKDELRALVLLPSFRAENLERTHDELLQAFIDEYEFAGIKAEDVKAEQQRAVKEFLDLVVQSAEELKQQVRNKPPRS